MRIYSVATCAMMIAHYRALAANTERTANVRALALCSLSDWLVNLERAEERDAANWPWEPQED